MGSERAALMYRSQIIVFSYHIFYCAVILVVHKGVAGPG